ncbi:MAG: RCC1 domain-containing protein [bacterium]|nr:RCC1 domain-containing protein [bacterium]
MGGSVSGGSGFSAVAVGYRFGCAVRSDGSVVCWGDNEFGQTDAPRGRFVDVVTDVLGTACGLRVDGRGECWGRHGEEYTAVLEGELAAVEAGVDVVCGIRRAGGTVVCSGDYRDDYAPWVPGWTVGVPAVALAVESFASCLVTGAGRLMCNSSPRHDFAPPPGGGFVSVVLGYRHGCALREGGEVACWDGPQALAEAPGGRFEAVSVGGGHACGLRPSGLVECWGRDDWGETRAPGGAFAAVSAGSDLSCGLRPGGEAECWGDNSWWAASPPPGRFSAAAAGRKVACGIRPGGAAECWGLRASDHALTGAFGSLSLDGHGCGLRPDGRLACLAPEVHRRHYVHSPPDGPPGFDYSKAHYYGQEGEPEPPTAPLARATGAFVSVSGSGSPAATTQDGAGSARHRPARPTAPRTARTRS